MSSLLSEEDSLWFVAFSPLMLTLASYRYGR